MSHTYTSVLIHTVFSTKDRRNSISRNVANRLGLYISGIARKNDMKALASGGTENHLHVLLSLPSTMPVAKALQLVKGGSSKWIHETFPTHADFAWQEGYGAFSVSVSGVDETIAYINGQEEHHRTRSFEEEYVEFLRRHGMEYDERYVWG